MCYMLSKQQYLSDKAKSWHPHLMFFVSGDSAKSWGANLPGSPGPGNEAGLTTNRGRGMRGGRWLLSLAVLTAGLTAMALAQPPLGCFQTIAPFAQQIHVALQGVVRGLDGLCGLDPLSRSP